MWFFFPILKSTHQFAAHNTQQLFVMRPQVSPAVTCLQHKQLQRSEATFDATLRSSSCSSYEVMFSDPSPECGLVQPTEPSGWKDIIGLVCSRHEKLIFEVKCAGKQQRVSYVPTCFVLISCQSCLLLSGWVTASFCWSCHILLRDYLVWTCCSLLVQPRNRLSLTSSDPRSVESALTWRNRCVKSIRSAPSELTSA